MKNTDGLPASNVGSSSPDAERKGALRAEIARLPTLDFGALRLRWRNETGRTAPAHLPKFLLLRMLAYRMQANVYGDLDQTTVKMLHCVARQKKREAADRTAGIRRRPSRTLKPGTILVREWEGKLQRVAVLGDGYAWNGRTFRSLSSVARAITRTQWSGPRFFGLLPREYGATATTSTGEEAE